MIPTAWAIAGENSPLHHFFGAAGHPPGRCGYRKYPGGGCPHRFDVLF